MLPQDPNILLSFLNMKLRDRYPSLSALCEDMDEDEGKLLATMKDAGYHYDAGQNRFV